jgi:hypothetical protein
MAIREVHFCSLLQRNDFSRENAGHSQGQNLCPTAFAVQAAPALTAKQREKPRAADVY